MGHPFFDSFSYPWHLAEAGALQAALSQAEQHPQRIELQYLQCWRDLPPLNLNEPADLIWSVRPANRVRGPG